MGVAARVRVGESQGLCAAAGLLVRHCGGRQGICRTHCLFPLLGLIEMLKGDVLLFCQVYYHVCTWQTPVIAVPRQSSRRSNVRSRRTTSNKAPMAPIALAHCSNCVTHSPSDPALACL